MPPDTLEDFIAKSLTMWEGEIGPLTPDQRFWLRNRLRLCAEKTVEATRDTIMGPHEPDDAGYCDTGADMDWACRSECVELALVRFNRRCEAWFGSPTPDSENPNTNDPEELARHNEAPGTEFGSEKEIFFCGDVGCTGHRVSSDQPRSDSEKGDA